MSSTAVAERLGAAEAKHGQLVEENRALNARLAAVEEQLAQRNCELATVEATNSQLLQEKRDLAERLAKGKELVGALVATVPELAFLSFPDGGGGCAGGGSDGGGTGGSVGSGGSGGASGGGSHRSTVGNTGSGVDPSGGSILGTPQHSDKLAGEAAGEHEPATIPAAIPAALERKTLPIGLLFPNIGFQYVGMMSGVKDIPAVQGMLEKASGILGVDMLQLCLEGPASELAELRHLATYIADLAALEKLQSQREEAVVGAQVMAGVGVGQCAALAAAGVFPFEDGLKLVSLHLDVAREAAITHKGAMVWVAGLRKPEVAALCTTALMRVGSGAVCHISGEYSSMVFTVSGTEKSVLVVKELAEKAGAVPMQVVPEPVPSQLPQHRQNAFLDELLPKIRPPRTTVYMTGAGAPMRPGENPKDIVEMLKKELTAPVWRWETIVKAMIKEGVSEFYELGPGERLKGHMRHIDATAWCAVTNVKV